MIRRQSSNTPLASTFVRRDNTSDQEEPRVAGIRRLRLEVESSLTYPEANVAIEVQFIDRHKYLFVALDVESKSGKYI